jgi:uncharacterized protein YecE (DUF72 family)
MAGKVRVGISGWRYASWRGDFYPKGLRQGDELAYAAARFDSIELNGSFYALQRPERYANWRHATPDDFVFAVKGGRFITHMLRLRKPQQALANFFASGILALDAKLGPILWQFPADLAFDAGTLDTFCSLLPRSMAEASRLAQQHDDKVTGGGVSGLGKDRPLVHAVEIRSARFAVQDCFDILRAHDIALVVSDGARRWPMVQELTATGCVYVRLHGHTRLYASSYSVRSLDRWAHRIHDWTTGASAADGRGRAVYVYFDNDADGHAPHDARKLAALVRDRPDRE